jgi:hypothetical protein
MCFKSDLFAASRPSSEFGLHGSSLPFHSMSVRGFWGKFSGAAMIALHGTRVVPINCIIFLNH